MKKASEAQTEQLLRKKVDKITDLSEVLAGKKPVGGRIGKKIAKQKDLESDLKLGAKIRDKKFKTFDKYCERLENIANNHEEETKAKKHKIKIQRKSIVDPKKPNIVI
jgi:dihydrodipicolinate reductase